LAPQVLIDQRAADQFTRPARILWSGAEALKEVRNRKPLDYFMKLFPTQLLDTMIQCTSQRMHENKKKTPVTKGEILKFLGARLGMTLEPRKGGLEVYWSTEDDKEGFSQGANYGKRIGMSFNRFITISQNLCFSERNDGVQQYEVSKHYCECFYARLSN